MRNINNLCRIENCTNSVYVIKDKLCSTHYARKRRNGSPEKLVNCQYLVNHNILDRDLDDNTSWLLGMLWTDGSIKGNTINITSKDLEIIHNFKTIFQTNKKIGIKSNNVYCLNITSQNISNKLKEYGMYNNKTFTIKYPKNLNIVNFGSFFRGCIDGDGCVYLKTKRNNKSLLNLVVSLTGSSIDFINQISVILNSYNISNSIYTRGQFLKNGLPSKRWKGHNIYSLEICKHSSLIELYQLLYPNNDVLCLHRKKNNFDIWMNLPKDHYGNVIR